MSVSAIIVAAGSGSRLGGDVPKQYLSLGDKKVIEYSIQIFMSHPDVDNVVVVTSASHTGFYEPIFKNYRDVITVNGGVERSDSVKAGLSALSGDNTEKVLIHDAARPFVLHEVIDRVIDALNNDLAVIPVIPVVDTIKTGREYVGKTIDRSTLNSVQTPQGFCYKTLVNAYADLPSFTDDAQAMELLGVPVCMVEGGDVLFKITTSLDQSIAETVVKRHNV